MAKTKTMTMKVEIDGNEVEFQEEIKLIEENVIIGCNCNGGLITKNMAT